MNWFLLALRNTFNFKDRARRREYGWFWLGQALVSLVIELLFAASGILNLEVLAVLFGAINIVLGLWFFIAGVSATARRLHDLGYSGWLQLLPTLFGFIIYAYSLYVSTLDPMDAEMMGFGIAKIAVPFLGLFFLSGIFLLCLLFKDGQRTANKYGADPKAPTENNLVQTSL